MKVLVCPMCGKIRYGVPRRQKTCSVECAKPAYKAGSAKANGPRHARALDRVKHLSPLGESKDDRKGRAA
jgi:hypothetical protein